MALLKVDLRAVPMGDHWAEYLDTMWAAVRVAWKGLLSAVVKDGNWVAQMVDQMVGLMVEEKAYQRVELKVVLMVAQRDEQ